MAIVLPQGRPAIDIVDGGYDRPDAPWAHLGDPGPRARLEAAIGAVGRLEQAQPSSTPFMGTAFAVASDRVLTFRADLSHSDEPSPMVVDFGQELGSTEPVRVEIEDVLYVDERWGAAVMRATLPDAITPLRLSLLDWDELADREVVLFGYPASDTVRNDPALVQRIFRGVVDVKRMLPGRTRGRELEGEDRAALVHDCSSTGGCAGGPLVDVSTGEVVGMHFGGRYLVANQAAPARELARDASFVAAGVSFAGDVPTADRGFPSANQPIVGGGGGPLADEIGGGDADIPLPPLPLDEDEDLASVAPGVVPGPPVAPEPDSSRVAIAATRPALPAERWETELDDAWKPLLMPHERRVDTAVRGVGMLYTESGERFAGGTAFMVGHRLALTASFVTLSFAEGAGHRASLKPGMTPLIDFGGTFGAAPGSATAAVTAVKFIHPYFHVALLELDRMPEGVTTLELAAQMPSKLSGRLITVIAFAAADFVEGSSGPVDLDPKRWGRLFVRPGRALQLGRLGDDPGIEALVHDCSSGAGSSGGPVIDLETGYVIGVHTHAKATEGGFAQPTWELARDPHVWESTIDFRPDPRPPWLDRWADVGAAPAAPPRPATPEPAAARWTVDEVPIDWTSAEARALERLLSQTVNPQMAVFLAENVGLPLGTVDRSAPPMLLWREILKTASIAGLLRRLLEELATDPNHAGIAGQIKTYL